ncbi:FadR/GntR family transcriptional regulator [Arthrobacter sp. 131MFCol6.1]|uniref:FadR/GntR family transcriptional regulator n=1 Tax=Arthrobacter sp. 131MFCol6.1 TaxID=1157944 RepID=UPI0003A158F2|nr:FadR/GntR family transcriptional regulator [Arthrobacter sp. 131MFCol6.1]
MTPSTEPRPTLRRSVPMGAEVAAYLEREIASRGLLPGDKLPTERELAAKLSVSRGTVRSALQDLESKHLLERAPGRGTRVAAPPAPVSELYARLAGVDQAQQDVEELRGSMEPLVAELAALRSSAADLIQLQDVLNASNEHLSPEEALRLDIQFHTLLAQAARNQLMATVLTLTSSWTTEVRLRSHSTPEGRRSSIEGHRHILEAIQTRDATGAGIAMRDHLADVAILIRGHQH